MNGKSRCSHKMPPGQSSLPELLGCGQHGVLCAFHHNEAVGLLLHSTGEKNKAQREVSDLLNLSDSKRRGIHTLTSAYILS